MYWYCGCFGCFFFFKQKTAYEMRISDWSSDVCSSDLVARVEIALECRKCPRADRIAHVLHQILIKMQIMLRHQHRAEHLARADEVMQIGARPGRADGAGTVGIERRLILGEFGVRILIVPSRVNACPLRPDRVGNTQSNMSTPRATAPTRSSGLPTPIR